MKIKMLFMLILLGCMYVMTAQAVAPGETPDTDCTAIRAGTNPVGAGGSGSGSAGGGGTAGH